MQSSATHHSLVEVTEEDVMGYLTIALYDGLSKFKVAFRSNTTSKVGGEAAPHRDGSARLPNDVERARKGIL